MNVLMPDDLLELYTTGYSKPYKEIVRNPRLYEGFHRAVEAMMVAENVEQLKQFSYLHYEQLRYQYAGKSSVRLCNGYVHRLLFTESENGIELKLVEIDNTHYGNK